MGLTKMNPGAIAEAFVAQKPLVSPAVVELTRHASQPLPIAQLESIVLADAHLSLQVLALANSAFYSSQQKVESLRTALILLGDRMIYRLAAGALAHGLMGGHVSDTHVWRRSLSIAVSARKVAELHRATSPDVAFATGLFHEIGEIALTSLCSPIARGCSDTSAPAISAAIADIVGLPNSMVSALANQIDAPNLATAGPLSQTVGLGYATAIEAEQENPEAPWQLAEWEATLTSLDVAASDLQTLRQELNVIVDAELLRPEHFN